MIKNSKLVFVDSEINTVGNSAKAKIIFPPSAFSVLGQDKMRLTLLSFEMRRSWYSINQTNGIFYIYDPDTPSYTEIVIPPGSYETFTELAAAIQTALRVTLASATATYDKTSRKLQLNLAGIATNAFVVCFQVKQGSEPTGVSKTGFFQDVHEILGAIPSRTDTPVNGFDTIGPTNHSSIFPAQLNTLEAIYLRSSLMSGNFQTYGHERYLPDQNGLVPTQIFARIPLNKSCYDPLHPFVVFEDNNDLFQMNLDHKHLDNMELFITDDKGRLLAEVDSRQADLGLMSYKLVFRWDSISQPPPPMFLPHVSRNHVPSM